MDSQGQPVAGKTFVSFYMGDYDGGWIDQYLHRDAGPDLAADIPLSWGISPASADVFAPGILFLYENLSKSATIVAGAGGAGYLNPCALEARPFGSLPKDLSVWSAFSRRWYDKTGLDLTGFVVEAPYTLSARAKRAYAEFSPAGVGRQFATSNGLVDGTPFLGLNAEYLLPGIPPANDGPHRRTLHHLLDASSLAAKWQQGLDPLSQYLRDQMDPEGRSRLLRWRPSAEVPLGLKESILETLNRVILGDRSVWTVRRFASVTLREETGELLRSSPSGESLRRLNRLLLEDGYPTELWTPSGAERIVSALGTTRGRFHALRLILWNPQAVATMAAEIRRRRSDVEFVNLHELMLLYRQASR